MIFLKKIFVSTILMYTCFSNAALEFSISSKIPDKNNIVFSNFFDVEIKDNITKYFTFNNNINIIKTDKKCEDFEMNNTYYCLEVNKKDNEIISSLYEKNYDTTIKIKNFKVDDFENNYILSKSLGNELYKSIFNKESMFDSKLAYVERFDLKNNQIFKLIISDFDGTNKKNLISSPQPIMSINWSSDNSKIAYVSFEDVRSSIYIYDFKNNKKTKVTSFKGINAFPSWSPDNKNLILSLSKDGSSDLFLYSIAQNSLKKITSFSYDAIEPNWLTNEDILFTANRSGMPYLYKLNLKTKKHEIVSKKYKYTTSPKITNDKKTIYSVYNKNGSAGILETIISTGDEKILNEDFFAESPSVAKGDEFIIYSTKDNNKDILKIMNKKGDIIYQIKSNNGFLKEPSFSN